MDPYRHLAVGKYTKDAATADATYDTATDRVASLETIDVSGSAAATLTVTIGGVDKIKLDFADAFVYSKSFPPGLYSGAALGDDVVVSISAGTKKINFGGTLYANPL